MLQKRKLSYFQVAFNYIKIYLFNPSVCAAYHGNPGYRVTCHMYLVEIHNIVTVQHWTVPDLPSPSEGPHAGHIIQTHGSANWTQPKCYCPCCHCCSKDFLRGCKISYVNSHHTYCKCY